MRMGNGWKRGILAAAFLGAAAVTASAKDAQFCFQGANNCEGSFHFSLKQDNVTDADFDMEFAEGTTEAEAADMLAAKLTKAGFSGVSSAGGSVFVLGAKHSDSKKNAGGEGTVRDVLAMVGTGPGDPLRQACVLTSSTNGSISCTYGATDPAVVMGITFYAEISVPVLPTDTTTTINDRIMVALAAQGVTATRISDSTIQLSTMSGGFPVRSICIGHDGVSPENEGAHLSLDSGN